MPNTELGDINTAPTGGVTPVENKTYQAYSYSFTATQSQEYLSLLFRNDPGFTWLDTVAVVTNGDPTDTNILINGGFDAGGQPGNEGVPIGWNTITTAGLANKSGGALGTATTSLDQAAAPQAGQYFWVDDATGGYDGLSQQMNLIVGATYTLSFELAVNPLTSTGGANAGIDTQVWVGPTVQPGVLACFSRGTHILSSRGEVRVEDLAAGDLVVTVGGQGPVLKPVLWVGRSPFDAGRHPHPERVIPVRIVAGALGEDLPHRDLVVSPGHALLLDGVLIQADRLVNGATILRDRTITRGEYFHVELATHDVLLSEGVASESYLDTGNRGAFVNGGPFVDLHPDFSPRHWTETCAPLVQDGPVLVGARQRLIDRAWALGWRQDGAAPSLRVDGRAIAPVTCDGGRSVYEIPADAGIIRLMSAAAAPADMLADADDRRGLGLLVRAIARLDGDTRQELALDGPALTDGWHATEALAGQSWRWTSGDAGIAVSGPCRLEVSIGRGMSRWVPADQRADRMDAHAA